MLQIQMRRDTSKLSALSGYRLRVQQIYYLGESLMIRKLAKEEPCIGNPNNFPLEKTEQGKESGRPPITNIVPRVDHESGKKPI